VLSPRMRAMAGLLSILIYSTVGLLAWPDYQWLTWVCIGLVFLRSYFLIRQFPGRSEE